MKIFVGIFLFVLFNSTESFSQDSPTVVSDTTIHPSEADTSQQGPVSTSVGQEVDNEPKDPPTISSALQPLIAYNFTGDKKGLSNLTPLIEYGYSITSKIGKKIMAGFCL